jgi:hypothetical protein
VKMREVLVGFSQHASGDAHSSPLHGRIVVSDRARLPPPAATTQTTHAASIRAVRAIVQSASIQYR